ncbi:winged helix-turn-helix domain-containing protein [Actinoallomurus bryophytorum]|uniref:Helix-turn-helix protein n=1 Tax=Actinoallomurus bryophytorum TaxID=1490222 RepID=A0A543CMX1_9ACTN|nr:winged helix-turn-helix domain-containing protein [Actinoallomurus bryophytorum]TQL98456.1 helix-turn-helix protein [Actinoallomurus bryophytorum]
MFASDCDLSAVARAIGEPARAAMLQRLMDGQAHTASALAATARISNSAATAHLHQLVTANLVTVVQAGRRKLHRLASSDVAVEALAAIAPPQPVESMRQARTGRRLQQARVCYAHLGGSVAVAVSGHLAAAGVVDPCAQGVTGRVHHFSDPLLAALGITDLPPGPGPATRGCLDWTERVPHLAGRLGATLLAAMLTHGWIARRPRDRALTVTETGIERLAQFAIMPPLET